MAVFTVRFSDERYIWHYELHPPNLISVAAVPCESQNTKKCDITVEYYQRKLCQM